MTELFIDIETRSAQDLTKTGVYRYVEDPEFRILMAAYAIDDGPVRCVTALENIAAIPGLWDPAVTKVAHNAQFERICFSALASSLGEGMVGYLDPESWHDTQAVAGEYGYPQKLELLAAALGGEQKDQAGTRLINYFSKPRRGGGWNTPEDAPDDWLEFIDYCIQDVVTLRSVHRQLGGFPTYAEYQVYLADQRINDYGIQVDTEMAREAVSAAAENRIVQELEITALTGIQNPGSQSQFMSWARAEGLRVPNLQADTVEKVLARKDLDPDHRKVFELRRELALTASSKYTAALAGVCRDGRFRGGFRFFGAHTGRWAGRGVQLQNLPRASLETPEAVLAAILDLQLGLGADAHTLKALVRSMFVGPFTVVDYAAIEARVLAWLAGETWALKAFAAGRDIYVETAERMGGLTRAQGKVAVLALGYNGGIKSLSAMGAEGSDSELQMMVDAWRSANSEIVSMWRQLDDAFRHGGPVGELLTVHREGKDRAIELPSGRAIHYHDVRARWGEKFGQRRQIVSFADPKKPGLRTDTYGGRLTENVTQAVARDILAEALVRLHEHGLDVAFHVHDEIGVEGGHNVDYVTQIMTEPPSWAAGLPLAGEGFTTDRYRKG